MNALPVVRACGIFDSQSDQQHKFHNASRTPVRVVERYEIELYFEDGGMMWLNDREYPRRRGSLLVARPGDRRCTTLPFQCHYVNLHQTPPEMAQMLDELAGITYLDHAERYETAFRRLSGWFWSDDPYSQLAVIGEVFLLMRMLRQYQLDSRQRVENGEEGDVLAQAQRYIEAHYHEEVSVQQIARACHVSASYLHRLFASQLSLTPHAALTRRRITAAKAMLIHEQIPIAEVAWRCGFHSPSYFSDCFRRCVGISPREFRDHTAYQL